VHDQSWTQPRAPRAPIEKRLPRILKNMASLVKTLLTDLIAHDGASESATQAQMSAFLGGRPANMAPAVAGDYRRLVDDIEEQTLVVKSWDRHIDSMNATMRELFGSWMNFTMEDQERDFNNLLDLHEKYQEAIWREIMSINKSPSRSQGGDDFVPSTTLTLLVSQQKKLFMIHPGCSREQRVLFKAGTSDDVPGRLGDVYGFLPTPHGDGCTAKVGRDPGEYPFAQVVDEHGQTSDVRFPLETIERNYATSLAAHQKLWLRRLELLTHEPSAANIRDFVQTTVHVRRANPLLPTEASPNPHHIMHDYNFEEGLHELFATGLPMAMILARSRQYNRQETTIMACGLLADDQDYNICDWFDRAVQNHILESQLGFMIRLQSQERVERACNAIVYSHGSGIELDTLFTYEWRKDMEIRIENGEHGEARESFLSELSLLGRAYGSQHLRKLDECTKGTEFTGCENEMPLRGNLHCTGTPLCFAFKSAEEHPGRSLRGRYGNRVVIILPSYVDLGELFQRMAFPVLGSFETASTEAQARRATNMEIIALRLWPSMWDTPCKDDPRDWGRGPASNRRLPPHLVAPSKDNKVVQCLVTYNAKFPAEWPCNPPVVEEVGHSFVEIYVGTGHEDIELAGNNAGPDSAFFETDNLLTVLKRRLCNLKDGSSTSHVGGVPGREISLLEASIAELDLIDELTMRMLNSTGVPEDVSQSRMTDGAGFSMSSQERLHFLEHRHRQQRAQHFSDPGARRPRGGSRHTMTDDEIQSRAGRHDDGCRSLQSAPTIALHEMHAEFNEFIAWRDSRNGSRSAGTTATRLSTRDNDEPDRAPLPEYVGGQLGAGGGPPDDDDPDDKSSKDASGASTASRASTPPPVGHRIVPTPGNFPTLLDSGRPSGHIDTQSADRANRGRTLAVLNAQLPGFFPNKLNYVGQLGKFVETLNNVFGTNNFHMQYLLSIVAQQLEVNKIVAAGRVHSSARMPISEARSEQSRRSFIYISNGFSTQDVFDEQLLWGVLNGVIGPVLDGKLIGHQCKGTPTQERCGTTLLVNITKEIIPKGQQAFKMRLETFRERIRVPLTLSNWSPRKIILIEGLQAAAHIGEHVAAKEMLHDLLQATMLSLVPVISSLGGHLASKYTDTSSNPFLDSRLDHATLELLPDDENSLGGLVKSINDMFDTWDNFNMLPKSRDVAHVATEEPDDDFAGYGAGTGAGAGSGRGRGRGGGPSRGGRGGGRGGGVTPAPADGRPQFHCVHHDKLGGHTSADCSLNPVIIAQRAAAKLLKEKARESYNPVQKAELAAKQAASAAGQQHRLSGIHCYHCGKSGHLKSKCPDNVVTGGGDVAAVADGANAGLAVHHGAVHYFEQSDDSDQEHYGCYVDIEYDSENDAELLHDGMMQPLVHCG
jgi:hypothetical protein